MVDLAELSDEKISFDSGKEVLFDEKAPSKKSERDRSFITLLNSPAIMASGSSTLFLWENPDEPCDRLKILLQDKQAGSYCNIIDEEIVAIVHKLLENKWISTKQHKLLLSKSLKKLKI